jgi:hypothetical protein
MSKVCILDSILEDYQAEEMAVDCKCESADAAAKTWFSEVYAESDYHFYEKPTYSRYVCDIEAGWELYYDYGAGYYFAVSYEIKEDESE